ncbi:energy transducer TonB [Sphingomonas sp. DT-207]|uniref:energy transducer TonB n=1 Tax=Sphingomonas sp. DT-207 TaxID=3396167 RepID=UPI003F1C9726
MKMWHIALALAATASGVAAAKDREPEVLTRTGKWVVDYDRDGCHLFAQFGSEDAQVVARFTRYQPGDGFDLSLYGKRFQGNDFKAEGEIDFGLADAPAETSLMYGNAGKMRAAFFRSMRLDGWAGQSEMDVAPKVRPEQEAAVKGVTVDIQGKRPFRLEFGSLGKPFEQMRHCMDTLVESWGYDPKVQAELLRPASATTPPFRWLSPSDYPLGALRMGHNGIVQFRLDVDAEGKVGGCHVLARTSPDDFADATCRAVTRRAKLQPALDAQGKPVRSFYVQKVIWQVGS